MIKGNAFTKTIECLHDCTETFFLTGSRYFETDTPTSDWDFFTTDTPEMRVYLENNGFICLPRHSYLDSQTVVVYCNGPIHVQLVLDAELKQKAQNWILENGFQMRIGKNNPERVNVWNTAFKAFALPSMEEVWNHLAGFKDNSNGTSNVFRGVQYLRKKYPQFSLVKSKEIIEYYLNFKKLFM